MSDINKQKLIEQLKSAGVEVQPVHSCGTFYLVEAVIKENQLNELLKLINEVNKI